jgi:hypothetical protein
MIIPRCIDQLSTDLDPSFCVRSRARARSVATRQAAIPAPDAMVTTYKITDIDTSSKILLVVLRDTQRNHSLALGTDTFPGATFASARWSVTLLDLVPRNHALAVVKSIVVTHPGH